MCCPTNDESDWIVEIERALGYSGDEEGYVYEFGRTPEGELPEIFLGRLQRFIDAP